MKKLLFITTLALTMGYFQSCKQSNIEEVTPSNVQPSSAKVAASRIVTETRFATSSTHNYIYVYNQSSETISATFYYNKTGLSSGWINGGTVSLGVRKDKTFCQIPVKQIKVVITYNANAGTYQFLSGKSYSCK